jgi:hypothetical protein
VDYADLLNRASAIWLAAICAGATRAASCSFSQTVELLADLEIYDRLAQDVIEV